MKKALAVIDTNILVSSLIGQMGYPRKIFSDLIFTGKITLCLSNEVWDEYNAVLNRERFRKYHDFNILSIALLVEIKKLCLWFDPKVKLDILKDKDDNKFIELALEAEVPYIVTGNSNDFVMKKYGEIEICTPKEYYDLMTLT